MYYMIYCEDVPDSFEKRRSVRPAHLQHLEELHRENRLLLAGPFYQKDSIEPDPYSIGGSLIIGEFPDIEADKAWAAADPYTAAEVFAKITVTPFKQTLPPPLDTNPS